MTARRVVLAGAGHAHLHALAHAAEFARRGHELVVIAPGSLSYSGLATGVLGGRYPPAAGCIDVEALAARGGARFLRDHVIDLDGDEHTLVLAQGGRLSFDVLSLDLGSTTRALPGETEWPDRCFAVKPVERLTALCEALLRRWERGEVPRVVVAGGGASACEIAANLLGLAERGRRRLDLALLAGGALLRQAPEGVAQALRANLTRRGTRLCEDERASHVEGAGVVSLSGRLHACDFIVNATGLVPHQLGAQAGLPARDGAMLVDAFLRSPANPAIHGGGDGVFFQPGALPQAGVYAIRQGPVLHRNLLAAADGGEPVGFTPQLRHLWIMNLGDGTGLAVRGSLWWHGRYAMWLKDGIDRRFLSRHRA